MFWCARCNTVITSGARDRGGLFHKLTDLVIVELGIGTRIRCRVLYRPEHIRGRPLRPQIDNKRSESKGRWNLGQPTIVDQSWALIEVVLFVYQFLENLIIFHPLATGSVKRNRPGRVLADHVHVEPQLLALLLVVEDVVLLFKVG